MPEPEVVETLAKSLSEEERKGVKKLLDTPLYRFLCPRRQDDLSHENPIRIGGEKPERPREPLEKPGAKRRRVTDAEWNCCSSRATSSIESPSTS